MKSKRVKWEKVISSYLLVDQRSGENYEVIDREETGGWSVYSVEGEDLKFRTLKEAKVFAEKRVVEDLLEVVKELWRCE